MYAAIDGRVAAVIAVADPIKEVTPDAIKALQAEGVRVVMLSGDSRKTAEAVGRQLGIEEVHRGSAARAEGGHHQVAAGARTRGRDGGRRHQ